MIKVALKIAYFGDLFFGSQRQSNLLTIDGEIIKCLKILKFIENEKKNNYQSCCRTDSGVSAITYIVTFETNINASYLKMINSILKDKIFVYSYSIVPKDFHPRHSATKRSYLYIMDNENYDIEIMKVGAKRMLGKHDFYNFCKRDNSNISTIRTINKIDINLIENRIYITIDATSFLWKMIRKIIYSLKMISLKKKNISWIENLLNPNQYKENLKCVSPKGLILKSIDYQNYSLNWKYDNYVSNKIKEILKKNLYEYHIKKKITKEIIKNINI